MGIRRLTRGPGGQVDSIAVSLFTNRETAMLSSTKGLQRVSRVVYTPPGAPERTKMAPNLDPKYPKSVLIKMGVFYSPLFLSTIHLSVTRGPDRIKN